MVFSSLTFLILFFPVFLLLYNLMPRKANLKNAFILLASIAFYSWGGPRFIFVILAVTFVDFFLVKQIDRCRAMPSRKKLFLVLSVGLNLGILFYFKYFNFFLQNINAVNSAIGLRALPVYHMLLPIGISFYTFESITYAVDVYRDVHKPLKSFWQYQLYILLFPKLIAGPIVRYIDISDQIDGHVKNESAKNSLDGFILFSIGLAKKVLIANSLAAQADLIFNKDITSMNSAAAWIGAFAYTFQIYFDFSGYSDMAIGIGKMMGFNLPENFNNPYTATSITDFWHRWHITLSAWMKNYLYIPLGGNRVSAGRVYVNLAIVFLLSGLWHGASWNFVLWGAYHGLFLILDRLFLKKLLVKAGKFYSVIFTFLVVTVGWVIFRMEDFSRMFAFVKKMFSFDFNKETHIVTLPDFNFYVCLAVFFSFFTLVAPARALHDRVFYGGLRKAEVAVFSITGICLYVLCVICLTGSAYNPFIYFRF